AKRVPLLDEHAFLGRGPQDRGDDVDEAWDGLEAVQLPRRNPSMLDVFPIEAQPTIRSVEEEGMDNIDRRAVSSEDRISRSAKHACPEPCLFPNLNDGPVLRILAAFDVARDRGPLPLEGAHLLTPTDDEDMAPVPEDRRHHALSLDLGQLDRSPPRVDDHPIARSEASDVDAVHHRDPRERRPDRDDGIRAS